MKLAGYLIAIIWILVSVSDYIQKRRIIKTKDSDNNVIKTHMIPELTGVILCFNRLDFAYGYKYGDLLEIGAFDEKKIYYICLYHEVRELTRDEVISISRIYNMRLEY